MVLDHTGRKRQNGEGIEIEVRLPDGSCVWIDPNDLFALADSDAGDSVKTKKPAAPRKPRKPAKGK